MSQPSLTAEPRQPLGTGRLIAAIGERLLAVGLALLLLRSSFAHLGNPYFFLSTVYSYQLTGIEAGKWVATVLPYLQLVVGVCLLLRWWPTEAYLLGFAMFLGFVIAQWLALRQELQIPCGCFGASESLPVGRTTLSLAGSAAAASLLGVILTALRDRRPRLPSAEGAIS